MADLIVTPAMARILFDLVKKKISQPENENNPDQNQLIKQYEEQKKNNFSGSDVVVFLEILGFGKLEANLSPTQNRNEIVFINLPDETVKKFDQTITERFNYNLKVSALRALYFDLAKKYRFDEEQLPEPEEQMKRICELLGMQHEHMMTMDTTKVSLSKTGEKTATIEKIFIKLSDEKDITRLNELISLKARTGILPKDLATTVSTRRTLYDSLITAMENLCGDNAKLIRIKDELWAKVNSSFKPDVTQLVNQFIEKAGQDLVSQSTDFQEAFNKLKKYQPSGEYNFPLVRIYELEEIDELIDFLPSKDKSNLKKLPPKFRFKKLLELLDINFIETRFNGIKKRYSIVTEEPEKFDEIIQKLNLLQAMNVAIDSVRNSWYATQREEKVTKLEKIRENFYEHIKNPNDPGTQESLVKEFLDEVSTARDGRGKMETKSKVAFMNALNQALKSYVLEVSNQSPGRSPANVQLPPPKKHIDKKSVKFSDDMVCNRQNILEAMEKAIGNRLQAFFKGEKYQALMAQQESMSKAKNKDEINQVLLSFIHEAAQPREKLFSTAQYGHTHSCKTFFEHLDEDNKQYVFKALKQREEKDKSFEKFVTIIAQEYNSQQIVSPR
jgi:hypothetical protein